MSEAQTESMGMRAITVSRLYGGGGGEIAARLARRLGWRLVDHELVAQVAHELGITQTEAENRDERVDGFMERLFTAMQLGVPEAPIGAPVSGAEDERRYNKALRRVVQAAADEGHVVIVGRGGQAVLAGRRDVLHTRIVAPLAQRIAYVMRREQLDEESARTRIQMKDRDRARYLQTQHRCHPDDPLYYDLMVNTAVLDLDSAVDLICLALERKGQKLGTPEAELGPASGMTPYPAPPSDLLPPPSSVRSDEPTASP